MSRGQHHNLLVITRPEAEQIDLLARDPLERHDQNGIPLPTEEPGAIDDELVDTQAKPTTSNRPPDASSNAQRTPSSRINPNGSPPSSATNRPTRSEPRPGQPPCARSQPGEPGTTTLEVGLTTAVDGQNDPSWEALSTRLVHTKAWLDHRERPTVMWPRRRSHSELVARRHELDQIFDTAPNDQQSLITRLRRGDPQLLDDTAEVLKTAIETQHARRHWILEHWPHIVEYAEITNTLTHQLWGPDTTNILDNLPAEPGSALATAVAADEPWLPIAVGALATQWATTLEPDAAVQLHAIADYRQRWSVTSTQPLGASAPHPQAETEQRLLVERLTIPSPEPLPTEVTRRNDLTMELP